MNRAAFISGYIGKEAARGDQLLKKLREWYSFNRGPGIGSTAVRRTSDNLAILRDTGKVPREKIHQEIYGKAHPGDIVTQMHVNDMGDMLKSLLSRTDRQKLLGSSTRTTKEQELADSFADLLRGSRKTNKVPKF